MTSNRNKIRISRMWCFCHCCFLLNSSGYSGEFHVVFKHFQNLENFILNISKEKIHRLSCLVSFYNSIVQTVTISKAIIKFFFLRFIYKLSGAALLETVGSYLLPPSLSQKNRKPFQRLQTCQQSITSRLPPQPFKINFKGTPSDISMDS